MVATCSSLALLRASEERVPPGPWSSVTGLAVAGSWTSSTARSSTGWLRPRRQAGRKQTKPTVLMAPATTMAVAIEVCAASRPRRGPVTAPPACMTREPSDRIVARFFALASRCISPM